MYFSAYIVLISQFLAPAEYTLADFPGTEWATWDYRSKHAPSTVHTNEDYMDEMFAFLQSTDYLNDQGFVTDDICIVEKYLLTAGLFRRDLYASQFDEEETLPPYIASTAYDFGPTDKMISDLLSNMSENLPPIIPPEFPINDQVLRLLEGLPNNQNTAGPSGTHHGEDPIANAPPLLDPAGFDPPVEKQFGQDTGDVMGMFHHSTSSVSTIH